MKRNRLSKKNIIKKKIEERHSRLITINKRNKKDKINSVKNNSINNRNLRSGLRISELKNINNISLTNKKINVIISAYQATDFIEECLDSINDQTYKCNKILLGIDGCTETLNKIIDIGNKYSNLEVYYGNNNNGPYQMFNALIDLVPDDEFFQIFGADDVMNPNLLEEVSKYETPVVSRNDGVLFIKKEIFKKIGGFREWRCAADSDMIFRLYKELGYKVDRLPQLFYRREHDRQLTKMFETNHVSKLRKEYIKIFQENKCSPNPEIYIKPIKSKIIKVIIDKKEEIL